MSSLTRIAVMGVLALLSAIVTAETPDECAARLDQSIAISTYDEAADWWAQVERECAPEPAAIATYDPSKPFTGLYGWSGPFVFCVMSPTLNVRSSAGGPVVGRIDKGTLFTVDLASQELVDGFVWAKHDKGWSALFRYPYIDSIERIDEFTYPEVCPTPTRARSTVQTPAQDRKTSGTASWSANTNDIATTPRGFFTRTLCILMLRSANGGDTYDQALFDENCRKR